MDLSILSPTISANQREFATIGSVITAVYASTACSHLPMSASSTTNALGSKNKVVDVAVPVEATPGDFDTAVITVTSQSDPNAADSALLTTSVTNWQQAANVPIDVAFHERAQCPEDPNGLYILGGSTPDLYAIDVIYYYNAISDPWTLVTHLPAGGGWGHIVTCMTTSCMSSEAVLTQACLSTILPSTIGNTFQPHHAVHMLLG